MQAQKVLVKMANYMHDPERYDRNVRANWIDSLGYEILIHEVIKAKNKAAVYEPGCGTGILTEKLASIEDILRITAIDTNKEFVLQAKERIRRSPDAAKVKIGLNDAAKCSLGMPASLAVMSYVYHHVPDDQKISFLRNVSESVKYQGQIMLLDMFIPPYADEEGRDDSLRRFHDYRISLLKGNAELEVMEQESLELGLQRVEEFKVSMDVFREHARNAGLKILSEKMIEHPRINDPKLNGMYVITCVR